LKNNILGSDFGQEDKVRHFKFQKSAKKIRWTLMTQRKISVTYEATNLSYLCEFIGHCCCSFGTFAYLSFDPRIFCYVYTCIHKNVPQYVFFSRSFELIHTLFSLIPDRRINAFLFIFLLLLWKIMFEHSVSESWEIDGKRLRYLKYKNKNNEYEKYQGGVVQHTLKNVVDENKKNHTFYVLFY